jgi:phage terminase large subunit-like protein
MLSNTAIPREYGQFRDAVLSGNEVVNENVSQQMNNIDSLIANPNYYYDDTAIDGFIEFCMNEMTTTEGEPLDQILPSFRLWAEDLLSWYYYRTDRIYNPNTRHEEEVTSLHRLRNKQYLIVGRGAAKSMYIAFIQAYFLTVDPMTTKQIVVAPTIKQTEETLGPVRTAISRAQGPLFKFMGQGTLGSSSLSKPMLASTKVGVQNFLTNSVIEARPMRIDKLQGLRSKINTVDEWLSGKVPEDPIEALEQGASKIDDYVIVATSSEGTIRNGVGDSVKMELMKKLSNEDLDPHTSIWYYRLDSIEEVGNPDTWRKANPNLGYTVHYETYQREVKTMEANPSKRNDILAKRFGIPVEGYTYFFTYEETIPHSRHNFDGLECTMGADLSQGDDFCAFTFLFPLGETNFGIKTLSFVSETKMRKLPEATRQKYQEFVNEGTLIIKHDSILDMADIYEEVDTFIQSHNYIINSFGYDPYNSPKFVELWTRDNGSYGIEAVRQGARTESVPLGELKALSYDRKLLFDEQLMMFAMGNSIAIEDNNGNLKLSKMRADEKIDNVAALLDAWVAYTRNGELFQ